LLVSRASIHFVVFLSSIVQPPPAPVTESLLDCQQRASLYFEQEIKPYLLAGATVLVVAHANTIRALVKTVSALSNHRNCALSTLSILSENCCARAA